MACNVRLKRALLNLRKSVPTYRRPIQISASRIPLQLTDVHHLGLLRKNSRSVKRPPSLSKSIATPMLLDRDKRSIAFTLPVPPSINHQYATVNGRRLLSSTGRSYKAQVGQLVWMTLTAFPHRAALLYHLQSSCLALSIRFYFTSALRRDVDGGLKIAQDALCEGLGLNDNRIVETHLYKHVDRANPRIEVLLAPAALS
jgi:crossover junction endodeoxyribonuclease RusA